MQIRNRIKTGRLIVECTRNTVSVVDLREGGSSPGLSDSPQDHRIESFDAASLASGLQSALEPLNVRRPITATVCLPRSLACIHVVELPSMGYREQVAAVQLELEAAFGEEKDQYVSDFVSVGHTGDVRQIAVIYSIPKRILNALEHALKQSQIEVERITLSEFGYGGLTSKPGLVHLLVMRRNRLDAVICYRGLVVQSQSFDADPTLPCDVAAFRGALRRMHSSLPMSMQALEPSLELIRLQSNTDIAEDCQPCFDQTLIEYCKSNDFIVEDFALQSLFSFINRPTNESVDFAHPKRSVAPIITRRSATIALFASILAAGVVFWGMKQYESADLAKQLNVCKQELTTTEKKITALTGKVEAAARLSQWDESNVDWNEQIKAISKQIAKREDLYLVRIQMDNRNFWERKPVTRLEGRAKSTQSILKMTRALSAENPSFSVQPNGIEPNSVDPEFNSQFRVEIEETSNSALADSSQEVDE